MSVELSLAGRVALVTGASRAVGIGAAICKLFAQAGAAVFFTYFTPYDAERPWGSNPAEPGELLAALRGGGARADTLEADLSDPAVPARLFEEAENRLGPVDILVNNATYDDETGLDVFTAQRLDTHYAVNVRGASLMCAEFARRYQNRADAPTGGRIINLVSGELYGPMPDNLPYVTTKGAIDALTISLSASLAPLGVTVNAIDPGVTDTGWMTPQVYQKLLAQAPFGRVGRPEDAANLILFLVSPRGGWITGQIIHSRGGF